MPLVSELFPGRFLRQDDVDPPLALTIVEVKQKDLAQEGDYPHFEWVIMFEEIEKPLILNRVNSTIISCVLRSNNSDDWIQRKIELYRDPFVFHQGQMLGAIRMRLPRRRRKEKKHAA